MKQISMHELEVGDIFCHQVKLQGREAFKVIEKGNDYAIIKSRKSANSKEIKKQLKGYVILLRKTK